MKRTERIKQRAWTTQLHIAAPTLLAALKLMLQSHPPRTHGKCPVCGHHGSDCEANVASEAIALIEPPTV